MNLSITEIKKMPVRVRHWFIKRIITKLEKNKKSSNQSSNSNTSAKKPQNNIDMNKVDKFFAKFGE